MVDGIFTLHSILTHKPTAKEEQGSLELNFMQEVCSFFKVIIATQLHE